MSVIYWKSQYFIMHAASLQSMDRLYNQKRVRTEEEKGATANLVVMSALVTPFGHSVSNYRPVFLDISRYGRKSDK